MAHLNFNCFSSILLSPLYFMVRAYEICNGGNINFKRLINVSKSVAYKVYFCSTKCTRAEVKFELCNRSRPSLKCSAESMAYLLCAVHSLCTLLSTYTYITMQPACCAISLCAARDFAQHTFCLCSAFTFQDLCFSAN